MVTSPQGLTVECVWNVITTAVLSLRGILLPLFFESCTDAGSVDALKVCKVQTQMQK